MQTPDDPSDTVLVVGATGNIGSACVRALAAAGGARIPVDSGQQVGLRPRFRSVAISESPQRSNPQTGARKLAFLRSEGPAVTAIRVATRSPAGARAQSLASLGPHVQPVSFRIDDPAVLGAACAGVTRALVVAPFGPELGAWHQPLAAALASQGTVEHVVKVSVTGARAPDSDPPPGGIPLQHWLGEQALRDAGLPLTVIRPTIFMQHFLQMPVLYEAGADRFYLPTGDTPVAFLDCRDIGVLAAALLRTRGPELEAHLGAAYELTGPAGITAAQIAEVLSAAAGRPVQWVGEVAELEAHAAALGLPDVIKNVYAEAAGGWFSAVDHGPFEGLVGRPPRRFEAFVRDHREHFRMRGT
jgi:uncharacterized protein YbjT (DUF2867 family)